MPNSNLTVTGQDPNAVIPVLAQLAGQNTPENAVWRGQQFTAIWTQERERLVPVLNAAAANTIDANLKRVAILNETIPAFALRVAPLRLFSTSFQNTPLQGTNEIVVPYYALQTAASSDRTTSAIPTYVFGQATNTGMRKLTINKLKYQPLDYSSDEFRRQPWFDAVKLGAFNAEKLGVDIVTDVLSVITAANFGEAVLTSPAESISSDDVINLRGIANAANWPDGAGRSLIVNGSIDDALQKDPSYKLAMNFGGSDVLRQGKLPNLSGFEYASVPNLPTNAERLQGFIAFASAILCGFAPIDPAPAVRAALFAYHIVTDPASGVTFNYRSWGVPMDDRQYEVIECAYGYAKGQEEALKRIVTPA